MINGGSCKSVAESMVQLGANMVKLEAHISQLESLIGQYQESEYRLYLGALTWGSTWGS